MAVGFPTKANWAAGDVLTASTMDDLAGTVNLMSNASAASGSILVSNAAGSSFAYSPINAGGKNAFINGAADIAQRGTTVAANAGVIYTLDRWGYNCTAATTATVSQVSSGLTSFRYALRFQRTAGTTSTPRVYLGNTVETANAISYAGKVIAFSFYMKTGTNYSGTGVNWSLLYGTGTDESVMNGFTGSTTLLSGTFAANTTWTRVTGTATLPSTATEFGASFNSDTSGTAGADDSFYITGLQIEMGSVATNFSRAGGSIQGELALCQRYLPALNIGTKVLGVASSTTQSYIYPIFPVTARTAPTGITVAALSNYNLTSAGLVNGTPTAITFSTGSVDGAQIGVTTTAASPTIATGQGDWLTLVSATILFTGCEL